MPHAFLQNLESDRQNNLQTRTYSCVTGVKDCHLTA